MHRPTLFVIQSCNEFRCLSSSSHSIGSVNLPSTPLVGAASDRGHAMKPSILYGPCDSFCKKTDASRHLLQRDNPRIGARKDAHRHLILLNLDSLTPG